VRTGELDLLIASRSSDKVREIREILGTAFHGRLISLAEAGISRAAAEDDVEVHDTFRANALAKARYFQVLAGLAILADDSGIEVHAIAGAPGVRSKRFADRPGLSGLALDQANNDLLLEKLEGRPATERGARYVCAAVLLEPGKEPLTALGTCRGIILDAARGSGGFGYDPLFLLPQLDRSFGELTAAEKHRFSHRARAFRALAAAL
jgi:XTP/dITP diphosphohydrolase